MLPERFLGWLKMCAWLKNGKHAGLRLRNAFHDRCAAHVDGGHPQVLTAVCLPLTAGETKRKARCARLLLMPSVTVRCRLICSCSIAGFGSSWLYASRYLSGSHRDHRPMEGWTCACDKVRMHANVFTNTGVHWLRMSHNVCTFTSCRGLDARPEAQH